MQLFYNVSLISTEQQSELATHTRIFHPLDFLPIQATTVYWVQSPELYSRFSLIVYFIHRISSVYVSVPISQLFGCIYKFKLYFLYFSNNHISPSDSEESACNAGNSGSIPGLGRSPGEGNGNPLQYSCLGSPMDRGAWWATVHGVAENQTQLNY